MSLVVRLSVCFVLASLISLPSAAQPTTPPSNPSPSASQEAKDQDKNSGTSHDRILFAVPNFLTVEKATPVRPLTAKQKFTIMARSSFDYSQLPRYAVLSAISQAENTEPAFGQGAEGYGKRFGMAFADGTIENFMTIALLPSLLRQDPRYFRSGEGSFAHRAGYAVTRVLVSRNDSGSAQFNFSEVVGSALAASVSTFSYHPRSTFVSSPSNPHRFIPSDRTLKNTAGDWGILLGFDALTVAAREFWPDVQRKIFRKHNSDEARPASSNP